MRVREDSVWQNLVVKPIQMVAPRDAAGLLTTVMGDAFGREKSEALWLWKHQINPAGPSLGLAGYSKQGELIALRPFMRWRLIDDNNAEVMAVRAVDAVVHPQWQRCGIFSHLTKLSVENLVKLGIGIIFNTPNRCSGPGNQKMGWSLLGHPILWVSPRPSFGLLHSAESWRVGLDRLKRYDGCGCILEEVTSNKVPPGCLAVLKDAAFLDWRYGQHPNLTYSVLQSSEGWAILREDRRKGQVGVALVDYSLPTESASSFRALLREVRLQTRGAYLVMGPLPRGPMRRAAISRGFIPMPWRNVNLAVKPVTMSGDAPVYLDRASWRLTLGDLETF
ncbi:hypothetical protein [Ectothiorhodospira variabilis]|uniref:hypothetical protein n=1 Tax=Ectothiorhodospira variabilis TaxID=505694 RepID=UPI001EFAFE83|nr:hypothetical protein [Ectothiorhodospira variabilis]MCG5497802.1 hypothetical protein [Ectothiorhodospira variabilis]